MRASLRRLTRPKPITPRYDWWQNHWYLAELWDWLRERGDAPVMPGFLEKPWKWDAEWRLYERWMGGERCPAEDCPFLPHECPLHEELLA
jgi:hypothetical protein